MSNLLAARFQMAYSLGFHMIFAALGIGLPLMMVIAEWFWLKRGEDRYRRLARTWAKATGILFAIGAVSGTALSFELGLLWPKFMGFAGSTLGPAFTLEGYAFFMEAIFLGLYLYGWERLSPRAHWLTGVVVAISGAVSGILVVSADAWMQNPVGVDVLQTNPAAMDAVGALFRNGQWPIMMIHSTFSCYAASAFTVAGVYAWGRLRGRWDEMRKAAVAISLAVGLIAALAMPVTGHFSAQATARVQPAKLAAMEALFETQKGAPLLIGGIPDPETRTVRYGIEIPKGLSFLAHEDFDAEVTGLDKVPVDEWPNVPVTHFAFQIMVGAGMALLAIAAWYWWAIRRERAEKARLLQWALVASGFLGFVALEAGWVVTEVGRTPWIIYGVMRISEAVTPAQGLLTTFLGFVALYSLLAVVLIWLLNRLKHA